MVGRVTRAGARAIVFDVLMPERAPGDDELASLIAGTMGCSRQQIGSIRTAALVHDVGMIAIPDRTLRKRGTLAEEEWDRVRDHPLLGAAILRHVEDIEESMAAVQQHHERYDGTGYPSGVSGTSIALGARIIAVADAHDAMTWDRPYRRAFSHHRAVGEIQAGSGSQFDPQVVAAFPCTLPALEGTPSAGEVAHAHLE